MRVLVTSPAGTGHFTPLVPFIDVCMARGDDVLAVVPPPLERLLTERGIPFRTGAEPEEAQKAAISDRLPNASREEAAVLVNRELFGRLCTAAMIPAVEDACRRWRPDLVLHDACEYASTVVAERLGIRHAQVATSPANIEAYSLDLAAPALEPYGQHLVERLKATPAGWRCSMPGGCGGAGRAACASTALRWPGHRRVRHRTTAGQCPR